ncbi:MAG: extracellular solute-binding protein [Deltaproteobacteria bacterium]|nr:extracellular solute-binding protein [Deltaproteobacteria bacterium]MBI2209677.1 extracellular solute-binding protein [Deltaproteobacteria bacterium]MBI2539504.1 extracellular solute-binding protein [Deltaproteobacteria bacterium]MBI2991524.1 extracellular solute-binding protein [Deltaproteobacteria bacterium]MBI3061452.1 extracellular solute-binding protein [Deltaproteobacteria bacterium]
MKQLKGLKPRAIAGRGIVLAVLFLMALAGSSAAQPDWKREWEGAVAAAEKEGQVTVYGPPGIHYQEAIRSFQEAYSKIKLVYVPGSGTDNSQRLLAERRAGKYLADLFVSGSGTAVILFRGNIFDPLPPLLILPENRDPSVWFSGKHQYADPQNQLIFIMQGNIDTSIGAYNTKLVNPKEIKSHWDVLNPKWKGKMVAYDPRARGHIQNMRGIYYSPALGGEFIRRLFSEMDVTIGRDQRQMLDWVAGGKFPIYLFSTDNDVEEAARKGLPVGVLESPPEEGYMSAGFGHLALVNRAPHPNAAKVFVNWLLSKEGQLQWQKRTDNNSLRTDIPKGMLTDQRSVPREGVKYLNASLPQYEDVKPLLKIVNEALAKSGKK